MDTTVAVPARRTSRADRVEAFFAWCLSAPRRRDLVLALLLALPVPLAMALSRDVALNYTHHDVFIPLDAAWRTLNGQWPHIDYYSPLGLSYVALHGAAAWLWGMDGRVVVWANLLALPFVLGAGLLLGWRRLNVLSYLVLAALLAVLVVSPVFLDGPERLVAHLANYNRIGGGLCAVLCLWALLPPARRSPGLDKVLDGTEAAVVALAFLVLLTLKVTFFALAGVAAVAGCFAVRGFWRRAVLVGGLVAVGVAALELAHPGFWLAYLGDVRRAGAANTQLFRGFYTPQAVLVNLLLLLMVGTLGAVLAWVAPRQRVAVAGIAVVAAVCVLVATQNFGAFSSPLVVLVMVLARRLGNAEPTGAVPLLGTVGMAAVLLAAAPFLVTHVAGTAYAATLQRGKSVVLGGGRSDTLRTVLWLPNPIERTWMPEDFTLEEAARWRANLPVEVASAVLDDGLELLRRDGLAGRRIANLSFSNPFPVALRAPPPRGGALWWDEGRTFVPAKLSPGLALGDAEVVMVPKLWWHESITAALLTVVQPQLQGGFVPHQSRYWTAWVRVAAP